MLLVGNISTHTMIIITIYILIVGLFIFGIHVTIEESRHYKKVFYSYFSILIIGLAVIIFLNYLKIWHDEYGLRLFFSITGFIIFITVITFIIALLLRFTKK